MKILFPDICKSESVENKSGLKKYLGDFCINIIYANFSVTKFFSRQYYI